MEADYITIQPALNGYLVVHMVWQAHHDSYDMRPIDGPLAKKPAVSVALEEAQRRKLDYRPLTPRSR